MASTIDRHVAEITAWLSDADRALVYRPPDADEWSVMQLMAHITEVLRYWPEVLVALAAHPGMAFGRGLDDSGRTRYVAAHKDDSVADMVAALRAAGAQASALVATIPEAGWQSSGEHVAWGTVALPEVARRVLTGHLPDHLAQAKAAYAAAGGTA